MIDSSQKIAELLNLSPSVGCTGPTASNITQTNKIALVRTQPKSTAIDGVTHNNYEADLEEDYREVRENLKSTISTANAALDGILALASEGESARVYEVVSDLLKTTLEANMKVLELHKNVQDIKSGGAGNRNDSNTNIKAENITNNTIHFNGSSNDLLKMIKNNKLTSQEFTQLEQPVDAEIIDEKKETE